MMEMYILAIKLRSEEKMLTIILHLQIKRKCKWIILEDKLENIMQKNVVIDKDYEIKNFLHVVDNIRAVIDNFK
jgi:hypothetical protein